MARDRQLPHRGRRNGRLVRGGHRATSCTIYYGRITDTHGHALPDQDGKVPTDAELRARAYEQAYATGSCDRPHARWHDWFA